MGEGPLVSPPALGGLGLEDRGNMGWRTQWRALACVGMGSGWGLGQCGAVVRCLSAWGQGGQWGMAARGCRGCGWDPGGSKAGEGSAMDTELTTGRALPGADHILCVPLAGWLATGSWRW